MKDGRFKAWIQASRAPIFVATMIPMTLGLILAGFRNGWRPFRWMVVVLASFLVHLCTNLANDYFDHYAGADSGISIGGSRVIQQGKITPTQLRNAMIIFYSMAFMCGVWIVSVSGVKALIPVMLFSFFSSLFYTAPPVRYGYHGLGELFVGVNMGPIMVAGTSAALAGSFSFNDVCMSAPIAVMVAFILFYQSLSDIDDDVAIGKRTIASRLGYPGAIWGIRMFYTGAILSMCVLAYAELTSVLAYLSVLTSGLAWKIDRMVSSTKDWRELHDKGGVVRKFYLINGVILILSVILKG
jgi:1,4-dihydroxy-2-naphthoate octaprenyltransferase